MSDHDPALQGWHPVSKVPTADSVEARLQTHWAAQVLAAIGDTHLEKADDDGQSNLGWVDGMQILAGRYLPSEPPIFGSMIPASLQIGLNDAGGDPLETIDLEGLTLDRAHEAMQAAIAKELGQDPVTLVRPSYDIPDHAIAGGGQFGGCKDAALVALADWFHDANMVMRDLRAKTAGSTMPRVWPHHFDMGMLISLEEHGDAQKGRSIGIGMSPGDAADPAPYWYVNPYPWPEGATLPALPDGAAWQQEAFKGAKLPASAVWAAGDGQEALTRGFVDAAVAACRVMLAD